jgi:hypothetical protein
LPKSSETVMNFSRIDRRGEPSARITTVRVNRPLAGARPARFCVPPVRLAAPWVPAAGASGRCPGLSSSPPAAAAGGPCPAPWPSLSLPLPSGRRGGRDPAAMAGGARRVPAPSRAARRQPRP